MVSRRKILGAGIGGAALVAAGGIWRVTRAPQTALQPWALNDMPAVDDIRLDAFRHAILAPNPHNRQPWLIKMIGSDMAEISCDLDKRLPVTDPFDRQITIGFGAFLEIARIAALQRGYKMEIQLFPDGDTGARLSTALVAAVKFIGASGIARDPLYAAIPIRRSNKEPYDTARKVADKDLAIIAADGGEYTADPAMIGKLREEIVAGITTEMTTPAAHQESVDLMRIGHQEVDANPDGISLSGPMIEAGVATGQVTREGMADESSSGFKIGLEGLQESYGSIPALYWIKTAGNTRGDQIAAGRQYVRANLRANANGLAMHPMSQTLQEYAEVAEGYGAVHRMLNAAGEERIQMLARVGYAPSVPPSPRWPLETHII